MEIDWNVVRARFAAMTREELLEEAALRADEYAPLAQRLLAGEALARGISQSQIEERRRTDAPAAETAGIEAPALIASSGERQDVLELVKLLRERGIPAVARELDPKDFHASGHRVGRWGLMVSGRQAAAAAHIVEPLLPPPDPDAAAAAGCGGGCSGGACADGGACAPEGEEWPEDGDWWRTAPGENEPDGEKV